MKYDLDNQVATIFELAEEALRRFKLSHSFDDFDYVYSCNSEIWHHARDLCDWDTCYRCHVVAKTLTRLISRLV